MSVEVPFDSLQNMVLGSELISTSTTVIALRARLLAALAALGVVPAIGGAITGGTTGSVLFVGAGPVIAQDNANLFWDNANNRLGIGIATPTTPLQINTNWAAAVTDDFITTKVGPSTQGFGYIALNGVNGSIIDLYIGGVRVGFIQAQATQMLISTPTFNISTGNIGVGTSSPGGSGTVGISVLSLANGTPPVGGVANQVSLFSNDVAASAELFAMDEAGNTPQLTPHPADFLNDLPLEDRPYPWAYSSENKYLGKRIQVDMAGLVAEVEKLSGKQFAFITDIPQEDIADWNAGQQAQMQLRQQQIDKAIESKAENIPEPYLPKSPPRWMQDRGVK